MFKTFYVFCALAALALPGKLALPAPLKEYYTLDDIGQERTRSLYYPAAATFAVIEPYGYISNGVARAAKDCMPAVPSNPGPTLSFEEQKKEFDRILKETPNLLTSITGGGLG
ncbi:uncharacterized protein LOC115880472 isoform X1 [Sitophilus oryzae]|uniref:Uncharacterized protein LOC115880472 isoform X1 n=1 Tax=Sitophilus oryzae TaxID=7048 RepID=A0A6J2XSE4_SITOR|nr:uncharacterized protein LOC115880472 isoform X1 [Sitophilus oryzae]